MAHKVKNCATVNWAVQLELEGSSMAAYFKVLCDSIRTWGSV